MNEGMRKMEETESNNDASSSQEKERDVLAKIESYERLEGSAERKIIYSLLRERREGNRVGLIIGEKVIEGEIHPTLLGKEWWSKEEYRKYLEGVIGKPISDEQLYEVAEILDKAFWEDLDEDKEKKLDALTQRSKEESRRRWKRATRAILERNREKWEADENKVLKYLQENEQITKADIDAQLNIEDSEATLFSLERKGEIIRHGEEESKRYYTLPK